ncbi:probable polyol transporter 6 [Fagus crenata]
MITKTYNKHIAKTKKQNKTATIGLMEEGNEKNHTSFNKYACACAIVASMISFIFGYDTGVMSGAMIFIKEEFKINDTKVEILAAILNLCALVGSIVTGKTSDYIGRRYTIFLACILFMLGAILMGYGPSYAIIMIGRCSAGFGVGFALLIAPVYTAEISFPSSRGFLTSLPDLSISFGILLGYISNYFFAKLTLKLGWRLMLGIAAIPSLALSLGILKMPESPRWLVIQGRLGDAKKILLQVSNTNEEAEIRFHDIKLAAGIDVNCTEDIIKPPIMAGGEGVWKELLLRPSPSVCRILIVAIGLHFFQHSSGIDALLLYSPRIFEAAGVIDKNKLLLATIGIGLTKTIFILISTCSLDKVGMVLASEGLGFGLSIMNQSKEKLSWAMSLSIVSTYTYVGMHAIGLRPVTWVYSSELFPLKLRAQGARIGVAVNRGMNAAVSMSFISIYKEITIGVTFLMFASICMLAWGFIYLFLPETKGRSLEEMEMLFNKKTRTGNT